MEDHELVKIFTNPIKNCSGYQPVFGTKNKDGLSLTDFRSLYGRDPLYSWVGLDSDYIYAAHKAAGGITSFYRQLGIGCERLVREVFKETLSINEEQANWSYEYTNTQKRIAKLSLDARIDTSHVYDPNRIEIINNWLSSCLSFLENQKESLNGAVFEVRQGYKSADSKRQNADLRNAVRAYNEGYLPVVMIMSNQLNEAIRSRYAGAQILVLSGKMNGDNKECTYSFMKDIVGFNLEKFFTENREIIRNEIEGILQSLLKANT